MSLRIVLMLALHCSIAVPASAQVNQSLGMQWGKDALATCEVTEERRPTDMTSAFVCLAWVNGAVQGAISTFSLNSQKPDYCTPDSGGSTKQYTDIFLKFLKENPARRHLPAIFLFHEAMAASFPCKKEP